MTRDEYEKAKTKLNLTKWIAAFCLTIGVECTWLSSYPKHHAPEVYKMWFVIALVYVGSRAFMNVIRPYPLTDPEKDGSLKP